MSRPRGGSRRAPARPSAPSAPVVSELETALQRSAAEPSPEPTPFTELGPPPRLVNPLARVGLPTAFEIQARVLPDALAGRPLLGRARTGSGKTVAFGLPMLARLAGAGVRPRPRRPPAGRARPGDSARSRPGGPPPGWGPRWSRWAGR